LHREKKRGEEENISSPLNSERGGQKKRKGSISPILFFCDPLKEEEKSLTKKKGKKGESRSGFLPSYKKKEGREGISDSPQ